MDLPADKYNMAVIFNRSESMTTFESITEDGSTGVLYLIKNGDGFDYLLISDGYYLTLTREQAAVASEEELEFWGNLLDEFNYCGGGQLDALIASFDSYTSVRSGKKMSVNGNVLYEIYTPTTFFFVAIENEQATLRYATALSDKSTLTYGVTVELPDLSKYTYIDYETIAESDWDEYED